MTELEQLPARIDDLTSQISHLCIEMRDEFSAVQSEMAEQGATIISTLRAEIGDRDEARATQTRVLFEEVISRIALLQEGLPVRKIEKGKGKKQK